MSRKSRDRDGNSTQLTKTITQLDRNILRQIARDQVIEPFEGRKSLETMQKTRSGMEKGIIKIKSVGKQTGEVIRDSRLYGFSKSKLSQFSKKTGEKVQSKLIRDLIQKLNDATDDLQKSAKNRYRNIEEKARKITITYVKKGLEYLLYEDTEAWILKRANSVLDRQDLNSIEQIRNLSPVERTQLTDILYPHDSPNLKNLIKSFETTVNISLGAIVASNIPGTGIAVSIINMGKTLVKLGHRINIMSAIYGYQISSPQALFKVSASVLKSLDDWDNNPDHTPLDFSLLDELYNKNPDEDESSFYDLMNAVVRKEAYIAIPGVGMISLGKINLDDLKIDIVVKHLVQNYFNYHLYLQNHSELEVHRIIEDFKIIYLELFKIGYHKQIRKLQESMQLKESEKKWKLRLKLLAGIDLVLRESSTTMDQFASDIYDQIYSLPDIEKPGVARKAIEDVFNKEITVQNQ
ncbi:hypothetical protein KJ966_14930 [bacterium]|nr:hypothetical protein [bacterium]